MLFCIRMEGEEAFLGSFCSGVALHDEHAFVATGGNCLFKYIIDGLVVTRVR